MIKVVLGGITFRIGYSNGIYFAESSTGPSPVGRNIEELCIGLAECTGLSQEDLLPYLTELIND